MENVRVRARRPKPQASSAKVVGRGRHIKLRDPQPLALEHARDVARRIKNRPAPIRNGFIERPRPTDPDPPLAHMLRGGQGGTVRLKFLLSLLWFSVRPPHETEYPARGWAALLDLDEPETNGARRVTAAITWLAKHGYVRVVPNPGAPSTIYLRDERGHDRHGKSRAYKLPARVIKAKREAGEEFGHDECWVQLPATFWTNGWIGVLSGSAVAMLLVLLDEAAGKKPPKGLWHSPQQFKERFGLSQDTRTDGLLELEAYGIVDMRRSSVSPGVFDFRRMRNVYDLHLEQLDVAPRAPRPRKTVNVERTDNLELQELEELFSGPA